MCIVKIIIILYDAIGLRLLCSENNCLLCFLELLQFCAYYRIRQNVRGGKLSRFSWILAKRECFTIETFPALQLENNYRSQ